MLGQWRIQQPQWADSKGVRRCRSSRKTRRRRAWGSRLLEGRDRCRALCRGCRGNGAVEPVVTERICTARPVSCVRRTVGAHEPQTEPEAAPGRSCEKMNLALEACLGSKIGAGGSESEAGAVR